MGGNLRGAIGAVICALSLVLVLPSGAAADFTVTAGTIDAPDISPPDGICDAEPGPATVCTLRAAVQSANANLVPDVIEIPPGIYPLTIPGTDDTGAAGDLDITTNLEIRGLGAGATITGNDATDPVDRLIHVPSGSPAVALTNLTLKRGRAAGISATTLHGGAIKADSGSLTVTDSTITASTALGDGAAGGGIYGGPATTGVTLSRVTVSANSAALCTGCDGGSGGGVEIDSSGPSTLTNVTITGNTAGTGAGAGAVGGGLSHLAVNPVAVIGSTIASNSALGGGGLGGGNVFDFVGISFQRTIIADGLSSSGAANCTVEPGGGPFGNQGNNLEAGSSYAGTQCGLTPGTNGDQRVGNAGLAALTSNGGPTPTRALQPGSPAIDGAGSCSGTLPVDQRGISRPQGAACDIGAFELEFVAPPVTPGAGTGAPGGAAGGSPAAALQNALRKCRKKKGKARKKCIKRARAKASRPS